jgi:hypothetical protein
MLLEVGTVGLDSLPTSYWVERLTTISFREIAARSADCQQLLQLRLWLSRLKNGVPRTSRVAGARFEDWRYRLLVFLVVWFLQGTSGVDLWLSHFMVALPCAILLFLGLAEIDCPFGDAWKEIYLQFKSQECNLLVRNLFLGWGFLDLQSLEYILRTRC